MDASFWHQRWKNNQIGFHLADANPMLVKHVNQLNLAPNSRVFLPLCGKTRDIAWLLSQGYRVAGAELSETAVQQLFDELNQVPTVTELGDLKHYHTNHLDIFVGDKFALTASMLQPVDAIYDRAALVALPKVMRDEYSQHMTNITQTVPQLLICFVYDQDQIDSPPFSITSVEVEHHYQAHYQITLLETADVEGGLKGICPAQEQAWLLKR